ncbi:MAG TPA: hypothetical protein VHY48_08360 [Acidobacteriaceae bacterium]|nr:hypothetical protein [Acidobacteriaceae bacterium]
MPISPQRRKVVLLCAAVACMGTGPILLKAHPALLAMWIALMVILLAFAGVQFAKLKREDQ